MYTYTYVYIYIYLRKYICIYIYIHIIYAFSPTVLLKCPTNSMYEYICALYIYIDFTDVYIHACIYVYIYIVISKIPFRRPVCS